MNPSSSTILASILLISFIMIQSQFQSSWAHSTPSNSQYMKILNDNYETPNGSQNIQTGDDVIIRAELVSTSDVKLKVRVGLLTESINPDREWRIISHDNPSVSNGDVYELLPSAVIPLEIKVRPIEPGVYHLHLIANIEDQVNIGEDEEAASNGMIFNVGGSHQSNTINRGEIKLNTKEGEATVEIESSAVVSGFTFSEEMKGIGFTISGDGSSVGTTSITISGLLEGPYTVGQDGQMADYDTIRNESTGETQIRVRHHLDDPMKTSSFSIIGTRVVPEFPPTLLIGTTSVALSMIAIFLFNRNKILGLNPKV
jgi:hypothetical protein